MNEVLKEELESLLNNFWILKDEKRELYYSIKRHQEQLREFTSKNLGSKLIIHDSFIKLEKIPAYATINLGINSFKEPTDYSFLCLLLLFLEDKTKGTYFTLSSLIDYVKNTSVALELNNVPDWTLSKYRKSLVRAIDFLVSIGAINLKDESKASFKEDESAEALYSSTGLSNYVMRIFNNEIYSYTEEKDFVKDEWVYQDENKGEVRKYKVYRNLIYTPVTLMKNISENEIDYLKKLRGHLREELMESLGLELEVTKNMAFVYEYESSINKESFPNNKKITDIVLMVNTELLNNIEDKKIILDEYEIGRVSKTFLYDLIIDIKRKKEIYLSKQYKDYTDDVFFKDITDFMEDYSFIKSNNDMYEIYPSIRIFTSKLLKNDTEQLGIWSEEDV